MSQLIVLSCILGVLCLIVYLFHRLISKVQLLGELACDVKGISKELNDVSGVAQNSLSKIAEIRGAIEMVEHDVDKIKYMVRNYAPDIERNLSSIEEKVSNFVKK